MFPQCWPFSVSWPIFELRQSLCYSTKYLSLNPFMQSSAIGFASQESLYSSICDFAINASQIFGHSLMWALVMFFLQVLFYLWAILSMGYYRKPCGGFLNCLYRNYLKGI
jgi:hypothetical protein